MNTKEKIEVMQAHVDGKKIEGRNLKDTEWSLLENPCWNWLEAQYRIAPEQKKEGWWERIEIVKNGGRYRLVHPVANVYVIDALTRLPGFGGIEYRSPFDEKKVVRSMGPVMISPEGTPFSWNFDETFRPGIPVAAWFWREEE